MNILSAIRDLKCNPSWAMERFIEELRFEVENMNAMMVLTPPTVADRNQFSKTSTSASRILEFEKRLLELIPTFWGAIGYEKTGLTEKQKGVPENREEVLRALLTSPVHSFVRTVLNRRAWLRNPVYRINVNFEGYAHWNAAIFYQVARKVIKMSEEDVNLVLRIIPFNEVVAYRSIFAPQDSSLSGPGYHASLLSPERYHEMLINFCSEISNEIINHREKTGRRYSARDVSEAGGDERTGGLRKQLKHIYSRYRKTAERIVFKQKKGM